MDRREFQTLFLNNVRASLTEARKRVAFADCHDFEIELHGGGFDGRVTRLDDAIDVMYLGPSLFYRIIDIGVKALVDGMPLVFVRISGHPPGRFEQTWNTPNGNGPFKLIEAIAISER